MQKKISILGCGWLGLPLAGYLVTQGFRVNGSTTEKQKFDLLISHGIVPFIINITDHVIEAENIDAFLDSEIVIINFPPERRLDIEQYHPGQIKQLLIALQKSPVKKVLFISSTSVYPDVNRVVTETENELPTKGSGRALILAEKLLMAEKKIQTTVLRLAGLIGGERLPGRFLAGKKDVKNGSAPVNLIHRDDCIGLIEAILLQDVWGEVFNACAEGHPSRHDYYVKAAKAAGLEAPVFSDLPEDKVSYKLISSEKIKNTLGYKFKFPDPMDLLVP